MVWPSLCDLIDRQGFVVLGPGVFNRTVEIMGHGDRHRPRGGDGTSSTSLLPAPLSILSSRPHAHTRRYNPSITDVEGKHRALCGWK